MSKISIFVSYARGDDEPFVRRLSDDLTAAGFDLWFDRASMPSRQLTFYQEIRDAIAKSDRLLLVVGPQAVRSDYVRQEWRFALESSKCVNPIVRLDSVEDRIDGYSLIPEELALVHAEDFRDDALYTEHKENLVRQLSEPAPPLGKLVAVPTLPRHFRMHRERLQRLRELLLLDLQKSVVVTGAAARVGLQGMGGIGKSVLANSLARDQEVRRAFPDGIFWIPIGQEPNVLDAQRRLLRELGEREALSDVHEGRQRLRDLLASRAALLILDDVWRSNDADAFDVAGPRCKILITTRDAGLVTSYAGIGYQVQLPTEAEALALLSSASGVSIDSLPVQAAETVAECGRLPLALALCGGMVKKGIPWDRIMRALREARLELITDRQELVEQHQSIWRAMEVSIQVLPQEEQRRFAELAVFAATGRGVPEKAVVTFWEHTGKLDEQTAASLLQEMHERSLIQLDVRSDAARNRSRVMSMHDLMHDFATGLARRAFGNLTALHRLIREAYLKRCSNGWSSGPNDGYFFQKLAAHTYKGGQAIDSYALARDRAFLSAQTRLITSEPELDVQTIRLALLAAADSDDAVGMSEFCLASAHRLVEWQRESPIEALDSGDVERAWQLSGLHGAETSSIWRLLLAWRSASSGGREQANAIVARLVRLELPELSLWHADYAVALLRELIRSDVRLESELPQRLLGFNSLGKLSGYLAADVEAQAEQCRFALAMRIASCIPLVGPRVDSLGVIGVAQAHSGDRTSAEATLRYALGLANSLPMSEPLHPREAALLSVVSAQARCHDSSAALQTYRLLEHDWERAKALRAIGIEQARSGDLYGARQRLDELSEIVRRDETNAGWCLKDLAIAVAEAGDASRALAVAGHLIGTWRSRTLIGIGSIQIRSGHREAGVSTLRRAIERAERAGKPTLLAEAGQELLRAGARDVAEGAFSTAEMMASSRPRELLQIARCRLDSGAAEATNRLLAMAAPLAVKRDARMDFRTLGEIAQCQVETGDFDGAMITARLMVNESANMPWQDPLAPDRVLVAIVRTLSESGDYTTAAERAQSIQFLPLRARAFGAIGRAQAQGGDSLSARKSLDTARKIAEAVPDTLHESEALAKLAPAYVRADAPATAIEIADQICWPEDARRQAFLCIADEHSRKRDLAGAQEALTRGLLGRPFFDEHGSMLRSLSDISAAQASAGAEWEARETLARAVESARRIELQGVRDEARLGAVNGQLRSRQTDQALQMARTIENSHWRSRSLGEVAAAYASSGHTRSALDVTNEIAFPHYRAEALAHVALAETRLGDISGAQETLHRSVMTLQDHSQSTPETWARVWAHVACAHARGGNEDDATAAFAQVVALIDDAGPRRSTAHWWTSRPPRCAIPICRCFVLARRPDEAVRLARRIDDGTARALALHAIAEEVFDRAPEATVTELLEEALHATPIKGSDPLSVIVVARIASLQQRLGARTRAASLFTAAVEASGQQDYIRSEIATELAKSGRGEWASLIAEALDAQYLPNVMLALGKDGDRAALRRLLIACSRDRYAALRACGILALSRPTHATTIAEVVRNEGWFASTGAGTSQKQT
jgi:hypothetical protein